VLDNLQPDRRFARALFAKHDCRRGSPRIAVDFVPRGMERAVRTDLLKQRIGLRVLLRERILRQSMMFEKLLNFHRNPLSRTLVKRKQACATGGDIDLPVSSNRTGERNSSHHDFGAMARL
jgi:hypothetical protein